MPDERYRLPWSSQPEQPQKYQPGFTPENGPWNNPGPRHVKTADEVMWENYKATPKWQVSATVASLFLGFVGAPLLLVSGSQIRQGHTSLEVIPAVIALFAGMFVGIVALVAIMTLAKSPAGMWGWMLVGLVVMGALIAVPAVIIGFDQRADVPVWIFGAGGLGALACGFLATGALRRHLDRTSKVATYDGSALSGFAWIALIFGAVAFIYGYADPHFVVLEWMDKNGN